MNRSDDHGWQRNRPRTKVDLEKPSSVRRFNAFLIAIVGGAMGCALSLPMHGVATSTFNWITFAEGSFEFRITAAWPGARKPVLDSMRAT